MPYPDRPGPIWGLHLKLVARALRGALVVSLLSTVAVPLVAAPAHAVAPAGTTTLLSPEQDTVVGGNPTFSWTPVAGAVKYRVQVSTSDVFDTLVYTAETVNVHATPTTALPVGLLYWRVAPTDGGSGVGAFTAGSFVREWSAAPAVLEPHNDVTLTYPDDPLLFTWQPLDGAQRYNVQIDDDVNFISPLVSSSTNNTSFTLTDPQTNDQEFWWRVQAISGNVNSPWSEPRFYRVNWPAKPVLIHPPVGATVTDVVFQWSPVAGAATYQIQVSSNEDFTNNTVIDRKVKGTRFSPPSDGSLGNASYFWRVRAIDAKSGTAQNFGGWSALIQTSPGVTAPAQFTRGWAHRPTLLGPANGDMHVSSPTFRWTAVPHASHYELQISYDANFSLATIKKCYTNQTSWTPYVQVSGTNPPVPGNCEITENYLQIDRVVYWRVRAVDGPTNVLGIFSEPASFMHRHSASPTPLAPAYGSDAATPALRWTPVTGVSRYKVTLTSDTGHQTIVDTFGSSWSPTGLSPGKTYTWYVQSYDDQNRLGAAPLPQNVWTFKYVPLVTEATELALVGPSDGASSQLWPEFRWEPVATAQKYTVWYGAIGSPVVTSLGSTSSTSLTPTTVPPAPGTYIWWVDAFNGSNAFLADSPISTFVIDDLALVTGMLPEKCATEMVCASTPETPRLEWTPTPNTGTYVVYIARDAEFTNIVRSYRTNYPSFTPRESLPDSAADQAYYWFVQPCRFGLTNCGRADTGVFPTASAFRKRSLPIELQSPANGSTVAAHESISFSWGEFTATNGNHTPAAAQGAKTYRIQVSTVNDFASILDQRDVDQTTYTPYDKTYPEGPLFWRVAAIDGSDQVLTYSPTWSVIKATPPLVPTHPNPGSVLSGTPYFEWSAQPHAKEYEIEVYRNGDDLFSPSNKFALTTTTLTTTRLTAFTPTKSLPVGDYAWRVRRLDADARPGPWSSGGVFTVASSPPALLSPPEGKVFTGTDMLFTWSTVTGAAKYKFEASTGAGFASLIDNVTTVMTSWAPLLKHADGTIYWRVKALDADNQVTAVSATSYVVKDGTSPTVQTKTPVSNAPVSNGAFTVTFSEKVKGLSASTFTMAIAGGGSPVAGTVTPGPTTETTTATFRPTAPLTPGESYTLSVGSAIKDLNGNALVPMTWTVRTELTVDAVSPAVQQYWDRDTTSYASGGGLLASRAAGAKVSYTFTGTSASILGKRAPDGGYGHVYVDGVKTATVTFYSSTTRYKQVVWSKTGLSNAKHTVELRVLGTKPSAATSSWVYPDAFRYGSTTLEETSALVKQAHRNVALTGALGGSYVLATHTASGDNGTQPYVVMKFKGTGASWRGIRSYAGGIAKVYVDNVAKATVDTYGAPSSSGQTLYSISGLPNGVHTIKVVVTGTKRSSATGYNVTFDSFGIV